MRTFIAVELPQEIKNNLKCLQEKLKSSSTDVKWVEPNNIHLTLKFLGETDTEKIPLIKKIIHELSARIPPFKAEISSLGAFPNLNHPRVIWIGLNEKNNFLKKMAEELENKLFELGFPKENRPFSAHITLGRVRSNLNLKDLLEKLKTLENFSLKKEDCVIEKIALYKSVLTPNGPIYECLYSANLKTT